jgi:transcription-repair coupling factor (superfamily II helicase)
MKQGKMICYFVSDQQSDYYQSKRFEGFDFVQKHTDICKMRETNTKWFATTINFRNAKQLERL